MTRARGSVLPTALFVLLCIHALVTVILASLRADSAFLQGSDRRQEAVLRAQSGIESTLETLRSSGASAWEALHTTTVAGTFSEPPGVAEVNVVDGQEVRIWVQDSSDTDLPDVRTVWSASMDGRKWQMSSVVTVRREIHPGLVFGISKTAGQDEVFYQNSDGSGGGWQQAAASNALEWGTPNPLSIAGDPKYRTVRADWDGRVFLIQGSGTPLQQHHVLVFDSTRPAGDQWGSLPDLPLGFRAESTGLAVGPDAVFVCGTNLVTGKFRLLNLPLAGAIHYPSAPATGAGVWSDILAVPASVVVDEDGNTTPETLPFVMTSLQADQQGALFVNIAFQDVVSGNSRSTFARLKDGQWLFFPPPRRVVTLDSLGGYRPLELDDLGNVLTFAAEVSNPTVRGFYRFTATGQSLNPLVLKGQWKKLPGLSVDDPPLGALRAASIDSDGRLFLGIRDNSDLNLAFDTVGIYPLRSSQHGVTVTLPFPNPSSGVMNKIAAGGRPATGQFEYTPVNWF